MKPRDVGHWRAEGKLSQNINTQLICPAIPEALLKGGLKLIISCHARESKNTRSRKLRKSSAKANWKDSVAKALRKWFLRSSQFHCAKATVAVAKAFTKVFCLDKVMKQDFEHSIEFDFLALARLDKSIDRTSKNGWQCN